MHLFVCLAGLSVVVHIAIQVFSSLHIRAVTNKIAATIKSRSDLDQVRAAIQLNLFLGIPLLCNAAWMVLLFRWISAGWLWFVFVPALIVTQAISWVTLRPIERRFKNLPVVADEGLAAEYRSYVKQWAGFTIRLKSPNMER